MDALSDHLSQAVDDLLFSAMCGLRASQTISIRLGADGSQPNLAPKSRWRNSYQFLKHSVQLGCIAKSNRARHVGN